MPFRTFNADTGSAPSDASREQPTIGVAEVKHDGVAEVLDQLRQALEAVGTAFESRGGGGSVKIKLKFKIEKLKIKSFEN